VASIQGCMRHEQGADDEDHGALPLILAIGGARQDGKSRGEGKRWGMTGGPHGVHSLATRREGRGSAWLALVWGAFQLAVAETGDYGFRAGCGAGPLAGLRLFSFPFSFL
jgi:hypothetical protein